MIDSPEVPDKPKFFTIDEIASELKIHPNTARRLFDSEEGTIRLGRAGSRKKRRYYTIRIPSVVKERVLSRLSVKRGSR